MENNDTAGAQPQAVAASPSRDEVQGTDRYRVLARRVYGAAERELPDAFQIEMAELVDYVLYSARHLARQQAAPADLNMNEQFTATLTATGAQVRNDYYAWVRRDLPEVAPALASEGDTITEPLWELMKCFGPKIHMGMLEVPFVGNKIALAAAPAAPTLATAEEVRDAALEDAAYICEGVNNHDNPMTAGDCAEAIRALKSVCTGEGAAK